MSRPVTLLAAATTAAALLASPSVASVAPEPTAAASVTFRVEGTVRTAQGTTGVALGDPLVLEYAFDPTTPSDYATDVFATYPAVTSMQMSDPSGPRLTATSGRISVSEVGSQDQYRADFTDLSEPAPLGPVPPNEVFLQMTDAADSGPADGLDGLGLPTTPPDPALFDAWEPYFSASFSDRYCDDRLSDSPCTPSWYVEARVHSITAVSASPDADGDGVADDLATGTTGGFDDGAGTTGQVLSGGTGVLVEDAEAPGGVRITTTEAATVQVCGFSLSLSAGSDVVVTCGSVGVVVTAGTTTVEAGPDGLVTVGPGGAVTVDQLEDGTYVVVNDGDEPVTYTRSGTTTELAGGATAHSAPQSRSDCLAGGWRQYGVFLDQGRCVAQVSRP